MIIEYLEFDIDYSGRGVMYITCTNGSFYYYLGCGVFNNKGLKFDISASEILGFCNSDGVEPPDIVTNFIKARQLIEDCLSLSGTKTKLKKEYWTTFQDITKVKL